MANNQRPGVMLYFELSDAVRKMNEHQKALLLDALLLYGEFMEEPDFADDPRLDATWVFMKKRIDRDAEMYDKTVVKRQYAAYCRECKKSDETPVSFKNWHQMMSCDVM